MTSAQAEKFVHLLADKLKALPSIQLANENIYEKLETAIASLPNSSLKGTLSRNLDVYSKILGRLLESSLSSARSTSSGNKILCEEDYDILLSQNNSSRLVELLCAPTEYLSNFISGTPTTIPSDSKKIVDLVAQCSIAAHQEFTSNGALSVYPTKQSQSSTISHYVQRISSGVEGWMSNVHSKKKYDDNESQKLQEILTSFAQLVEFDEGVQVPAQDPSFSFYLPEETASSTTNEGSRDSLAKIYALHLVLVIFYPSKSIVPAAATSVDSDDDEESTPSLPTDYKSVAERLVNALLLRAESYGSEWMTQVFLATVHLPRPSTSPEELLGYFNRIILKGLRRLSFQANMSGSFFVRNILYIRHAKESLRRTRQGNAQELTSLMTRLTPMPIPFKLMDWMQLASLGNTSRLSELIAKVLETTEPTCMVFFSSTWENKDLEDMEEKLSLEFVTAPASISETNTKISDEARENEEYPSEGGDHALFFVDNVGGGEH